MAVHNILLVDDDELTIALLAAFLSKNDFHFKTALDGTEAVRLMESCDFDLVISDVSMDKMDGVTLLRTIREKGNQVPFIIMTAYPKLEGYVDSVQKLGAYDYIQKPMELEMLHLMIQRLLKISDA